MKNCRILLQHPISAVAVRRWKINQRKKNVTDLRPVANSLRRLLPPGFIPLVIVDLSAREFSSKQIARAVELGDALLGDVATGDAVATVRQRKGQDEVRRRCLDDYGTCCAVCDVCDKQLLVASHIVGWSIDKKYRGRLSNVVCLCRMHDALFERGYWSIKDDLTLITQKRVESKTIRRLLKEMVQFRVPVSHRPARQFLAKHRSLAGL